MEHFLTSAERSFNQLSHDVIAGLEGVQAHLVASGGFGGVDDRLQEIRNGLRGLADEVRGYERYASTPAVIEAFNTGASQALSQLEQTAEGVLSRMDERHHQLAQHDTGLAGALDASERVVRERFHQLEVSVRELHSEVGQIRSVRSGVEALGVGMEVVRGLVVQASEVGRDVRLTAERIDDVDRHLGDFRAESVNAAVAAMARLERQLDGELDEIVRRLDVLTTVLSEPHSDSKRDRVTTSLADGISHVRNVAAGVSDVVRSERQRMRTRGRTTPPSPRALGPGD
jgi:hypothetical protein